MLDFYVLFPKSRMIIAPDKTKVNKITKKQVKKSPLLFVFCMYNTDDGVLLNNSLKMD